MQRRPKSSWEFLEMRKNTDNSCRRHIRVEDVNSTVRVNVRTLLRRKINGKYTILWVSVLFDCVTSSFRLKRIYESNSNDHLIRLGQNCMEHQRQLTKRVSVRVLHQWKMLGLYSYSVFYSSQVREQFFWIAPIFFWFIEIESIFGCDNRSVNKWQKKQCVKFSQRQTAPQYSTMRAKCDAFPFVELWIR